MILINTGRERGPHNIDVSTTYDSLNQALPPFLINLIELDLWMLLSYLTEKYVKISLKTMVNGNAIERVCVKDGVTRKIKLLFLCFVEEICLLKRQ